MRGLPLKTTVQELSRLDALGGTGESFRLGPH